MSLPFSTNHPSFSSISFAFNKFLRSLPLPSVTGGINVSVNTSVGISVEYGKGEFVKWSFQAGYALYSIGKENWQTNLSIGTTIDFSLNSK